MGAFGSIAQGHSAEKATHVRRNAPAGGTAAVQLGYATGAIGVPTNGQGCLCATVRRFRNQNAFASLEEGVKGRLDVG